MLALDVLDGEARADFLTLVHESTVGNRAQRAAFASSVGGQVVRR